MSPYPRLLFFELDRIRHSAMIEEYRAYSETEEKKMASDYEDMEQESRLYPWIDDASQEYDDEDWNADLYYDTMYDDGQPDELTEWNDFDPDC